MKYRAVLIWAWGCWSAQCLDYDIAAQGATYQEAADNLTKVMEDQAAINYTYGRSVFEGIKPAPREYHEMWEKWLGIPPDDYNYPLCIYVVAPDTGEPGQDERLEGVRQYKELEKKLYEIRLRNNNEESEEEDHTIGQMDALWYRFTEDIKRAVD